MRISVQSQLLVFISLLTGLVIFSVLGWRYQAIQQQQQQVFQLSQSVSGMEHANTMQLQWLTTLDLFLGDRQSYLAPGIKTQTEQLKHKYQQIAVILNQVKQQQQLNRIEALLTKVNAGVQQLAYDSQAEAQSWQTFILDSDRSTEELLDHTEALSIVLQQQYQQQELALANAQQQLVTLAAALLVLYLLVNVLLGFWNSQVIVKPLVNLSQLARDNQQQPPELVIASGPTEIRQLSQSLQDFAQALLQQKQQIQQLYEKGENTRRWLAAVMNTAPVGIISTDKQLNILSANQAIETLFAADESEFKQKSLLGFLPELKGWQQQTLIDHPTFVVQQGSRVHVEINTAKVEFEGESQQLFILRDISRRIQSQQREVELNQQLAQSEKLASLGQLAAGVAHEINNPIGFIKANFNVLSEYFTDINQLFAAYQNLETAAKQVLPGSQLSELQQLKGELQPETLLEDCQDILHSSISGIERIAKIATDMKAFSHSDNEQMQQEDLNQIVQGAINLSVNAHKDKARLHTDFAALPKISCWSGRLSQVFVNLLINAAQAIDDKGNIKVTTYQKDQFACVDVLDTGSGISEEIQLKIFDPFFTTKPVGTGTGLGLHISHSIVEKHGGTLGVKSIPGRGSCFTVSLPVGA